MKTRLFVSLLAFVLFLFAGAAFAQPTIEWQKSLGGSDADGAYSIQQTFDNGFIIAGMTRSNDGDVSGYHGGIGGCGVMGDYWVVKLEPESSGLIEWQICLGGSSGERAESIQQTSDGGFIVAGESWSNDGDVSGNHGGCGDGWVVKLDEVGSIVWQKCLGGSESDGALSVQQTSDGGFIVAGFSNSNDGDVSGYHGFAGGSADFWIVKLDTVGSIEWQKCLGGSGSDNACSVQQTSDGGYIVAGENNSCDGDISGHHGLGDYADCWIVKLDTIGSIEWQKSLGGSNNDWAESIQQTTDGGFIVAGSSKSNDGDVSGHHGILDYPDYWVVKLNTVGSIAWQRSFGGSDYELAYSIQQASDGGFIVAGYSSSNDGDVTGNHGTNDYWVVKLDSTGNIEWQKSLGGSDWDDASSIQQTTDGGFIVAGYSESNDGDVSGNHGGSDYWVVKLSPEGKITEAAIMPEQFAINVFPNPFNSACEISAPSNATMEIFDINGKIVYEMPVGARPASTVLWQPNKSVPSGIYLVRAKIGDNDITKRIVYLK